MAFGLYLHIPFCPYLCSFCDFYKELHSVRRERLYFDALMRETELVARDYALIDHEISTIYVGGGTPSMTSIELFADWLALLKSLFHIPEGVEFSFEQNPDSVDADRAVALRSLGVTRPTIGIESFHPELLAKMGRPHKLEDTYRAVYLARAAGFPTFACDLMFGFPNQSIAQLSSDLDHLIAVSPPHISYYQLTIEPNTRLARQIERGDMELPSEEELLAMYQAGVEKFSHAGYHRYEVSSFALPGHECRHNIGYWEGKDYLGLGPSAHSFMLGQRFSNTADLDLYLASLSEGRRPMIEDSSDIDHRMTESILLGLRTSSGISKGEFARRFGIPLEQRLNLDQLAIFTSTGHLAADQLQIRLTESGLALADEITRRLIR